MHFLDDADMIFRMYRGGRVQQQQNELSDGSSTSGSVNGGNTSHQDDGHGSDSDDGDSTSGEAGTSPNTSTLPSVKPVTEDLALRNARQKRKYGDWSLYRYFLSAVNSGLVIFFICFVAISAVVQASPREYHFLILSLPCASFNRTDSSVEIFVRIWFSINGNDRNYYAGYVFVSAGVVLFNSLNGVYDFIPYPV